MRGYFRLNLLHCRHCRVIVVAAAVVVVVVLAVVVIVVVTGRRLHESPVRLLPFRTNC